jgi:signal transduction histidine kinase
MNVIKHAEATESVVTVPFVGGVYKIEIQDDGRGFDLAVLDDSGRGGRGIGLFSIKDRLHALGGSLSIDSEVGVGTRVSVMIA